jgi:2-desacetyl-2-hydroxyethyl bacteriochlorophyllide A dehydrogenase
MQAQALICDEQQRFTLQEVTLPDPGPDQIAVRTHFTGVSRGTEFALIRNKISWGPYPLCVGYQGTGVVEAVGSDITDFAVGDRVYYRGNDAMFLADGTKVSCVQGSHCSHAVLKPHTSHGADHLRPDSDMETASLYVMPAVGLYGSDLANPRMGSVVAIYGCGPIGLGALAACVHRGCVVVGIDIAEKNLEIARALGANYTINSATQNALEELLKIAPQGADTVFEATGIPACIDPAIELCRPFGTFVWQGNYGAAPITMKFLPPHGKRLTMVFPSDDGLQPCRRAIIRNMAMGALKWEQTITHRVHYRETPALYEMLNQGTDRDLVGVTINWQD